MDNDPNQDFMMQLLCESHVGLERQGPGSPEATRRAVSFLDNPEGFRRVADLGCGTGGQTAVLARSVGGVVSGLDFFPAFVDVFNKNAVALGLADRMSAVVGTMDDPPFQPEEFDLVWSEGAIGNIGFEKGLAHWRRFLKPGGFVAVTYESWFTDVRPAEIEKFWVDAVPGIDTIGHNISTMQKAGYSLVAAFALPGSCWTDNYFAPREAAVAAMLAKYAGNAAAEGFAAAMRHEVELYEKYNKYYGYVFYIGKKEE